MFDDPPGAYNDLHNHVGSVLSGVYYIEADPSQGNIQFERSDNADYHMPLDVAKHTYFTSTRASYASKTNALYVFPSWLKHSVQGNTRLSSRRRYGLLVSPGWRQHKNIDAKAVSQQIIDIEVAPNGTRLY